MPPESRSQSGTAKRVRLAPKAASPDLVFMAVAPMLKVAQQLRSWTDGVLGRHDPMTFAMKLSRTYNPLLWKALDELGIDRMVALAGRERKIIKPYRANNDARRFSDADFAAVLSFTRSAFDMGVKFCVELGKPFDWKTCFRPSLAAETSSC